MSIPADEVLQMAHEIRVLVFMENADHDGFTQVLLDAEQFKKMSVAICKETKTNPDLKDGYELCVTEHGDHVLPQLLFEGMESITE